jgi:hypothetical protein
MPLFLRRVETGIRPAMPLLTDRKTVRRRREEEKKVRKNGEKS